MKKLLVIVNDVLSDLILKGEITDRYYNPGDVFDEVHILLMNNDKPSAEDLKCTVGAADLFIYNFPTNSKLFFLKTLCYRPFMLDFYLGSVLKLVNDIKPNLVRCYMNRINGYIAYKIKQTLNIPYVISLHGNPDVDYYRGRLGNTIIKKIYGRAIEAVEIISIQNADYVLPVYSPIIPYLKKHNVKKYELIYNAVCLGCRAKSTDKINKKVKLLTVGRQVLNEKDPSPIIEAVLEINKFDIEYTLIGNGNIHQRLINKFKDVKGFDRIKFVKSMDNKEVLKVMRTSDLYVYSSNNYEISKTCIEASIIGLPIILNDRCGNPSQELINGNFHLINNSKNDFKNAILEYIESYEKRKKLGKDSQHYALMNWNPAINEKKSAKIHNKYLIDSIL